MARFKRDQKEKAYRIYVTDVLQAICNKNAEVTQRYADLIKEPVSEARTSEEIITNIKDKLKNLGG